jgi:hypothetical protein
VPAAGPRVVAAGADRCLHLCRASAPSGHDAIQRANPRLLRRRSYAAGRAGLPGPVHGLLPRAHRIRPALLPALVHRPQRRPAGSAARGPGAVHPVDARILPVQALHHLAAVLRDRRVLPHLRHRRRAGTLSSRARPQTTCSGRITHARVHSLAVRGAADRLPRVREPL